MAAQVTERTEGEATAATTATHGRSSPSSAENPGGRHAGGSGGDREGTERGPGPRRETPGIPLRIPRTCGRRPGGCGKVAGPLQDREAAPPEGRGDTERHPQSPRAPSPLTLV